MKIDCPVCGTPTGTYNSKITTHNDDGSECPASGTAIRPLPCGHGGEHADETREDWCRKCEALADDND